ncbi:MULTISPECIES: transporter substrate-binding domain-containing protein [unclassified Rhizobium]|uniref:transporter substrate-binding domain-containing protein n=1 Tax=unclassified Rhizobium TaxID=2613769 RepID=UPI0007EAC0FF|nr:MULTISPECIES: transporter substrate-binding domain-containing protein [unclassified Rhizobium]ANM14211.1 ABC transporter substrate-binding protein [Rhizobium sp. N324]ANM20595.1 ABC transporter substrate-binding protein [Rhizobium sp. N541]ANM26979.1 ABC transporter substrate-binding protein [Rhizobium sp. N941]OYD00384.1 ABC transporter substrate-binding protein [Rhizobium sp. N4311]
MNVKRILTGIAMTTAVALSALAAKADVLDDIKKEGVIQIGVPQDVPPFGMVGPDGTRVGYDVEMAELIGKRLGVTVELVPVAGSNRVPFIESGRVALVISSLGKNPEREKVIDFTDAYAPFFNGVFGPPDLKVTKAEELSQIKVGVTKGTIEDLELSKIAPADADIRRYDGSAAAYSAYFAGQVQAIATGNVVAASLMETDQRKKMEVKFVINKSPCFIGLKKGEPALLEAVNKIIKSAKADGSLNAISQKWMHADLPQDLRN